MYCRAFFAVTSVAPVFPAIFAVVIFPNRIVSFRLAIACSMDTVVVLFPNACRMFRTRHTIPAPGFVSSFSQLFTPIPVMSAGTMAAVLFRSSSVSCILSSGTFRAGVRLCPLNRIIYNHLALLLTVNRPARFAVTPQ